MSRNIVIALDVMGGDLGPRPCVLAAAKFVDTYPNTSLQLFGDEVEIQEYFESSIPTSISITHCSETVRADEDAARALRRKQNSSMGMALKLVASGEADACVSGGNTAALLALARYYINTVSGLRRPAICRALPTLSGVSYMLDLGANLRCSAENLYQFALMGAALARVSGVPCPKVALLNVGSEMSKGSDDIKQAACLLKSHATANKGVFQFNGFVEGDDLYRGSVDVIVCDGFSGNVALKVSEGLVKHLVASLDSFFSETLWGKFSKMLVGPVLKSWSRKKNPSMYNGAAFLGLNKTVIKSHGAADELGVFKALEAALQQVLDNTPYKIRAHFQP